MSQTMKNALRKHYIADWAKEHTEAPAKEQFKRLAKNISSITDDTDEETDDKAFYDGDGTKEKKVVGISESWKVEGLRDYDDEAQNVIASKKRKTGDNRKVWHKIVDSVEKTEVVEVATLSDIKSGGGDAGDDETFECTITFNKIAKETPHVKG